MDTPSAAAPPTPPAESRRVQEAALARHLARPGEAWLHGEIARRMAERLALIRQPPAHILDWASPSGASLALLRQQCPQAEIVALDFHGQRLAEPGSGGGWLQRLFSRREVAAGSGARPVGDLLWANMMLHWVDDLPQLLPRWQAALAVDGFLMFSCFGPDTLRELRRLYSPLGWGSPASAWVDMHDLGDALVQAGFADPVMDMEQITLTWDNPAALLAELRSLGGNTDPARHPGLRTPRWRQRLERALADGLRGPDGRLRLCFEIVYGHAFRAPPRATVAAETRIPLDTLRDMTRRKPAG